MNYTEDKLRTKDSTPLFYRCWRPSASPVAAIALIHGLGEHGGRYTNFVDSLVSRGCAVHSFDHRGHGRSTQDLCAHINRWADYRQDVGALIDRISDSDPVAPLFLLGHSMGGLIALNYAIHHPERLTGVIASAPALGVGQQSPLLRFSGSILSAIKPDFRIGVKLDPSGISKDPKVVQAYRDDPLVHGIISARWGAELLKTITWTHAHAAQLQVPTLIHHGDADPLVPIADSKRFFENLTCEDRQFITYEGGLHEGHNDVHRLQVYDDVWGWISSRL